MTFPRYSKYKPSGVEWLGDVPEHWSVTPCRAIVHERTAKNEGAKCQDYLSLMANVGIIPYADKGDVGNKKPEDLTKCKIVTKGDFVINSMNYGIGSYGLSDYDGVCSPVYIVLKPQDKVVESRFAFRIFENRAFQTYAQSFGNGILEHRCSINWDILKIIAVGVPPKDEQKAILAFLDHETAKIDTLIAEQQRLIELLQEKRQAVISHAVTKGLNPQARMKPSGIEWLGDVPEHWDVLPLKRRLAFVTSGSRGWAEFYSDEGELFIRIMNLTRDSLDLDLTDLQRVTVSDGAEGARTRVQSGDVLFSITAYLGSVAVVPDSLETAYVSQHIALARLLQSQVAPKWVGYVALSTVGQTWFETQSYGGTKIQLSLDDVRDLPIPIPPYAEQQTIVNFIEASLATLSTLSVEAQRAIDLLQERRTALISAAVTGQIDVRSIADKKAA